MLKISVENYLMMYNILPLPYFEIILESAQSTANMFYVYDNCFSWRTNSFRIINWGTAALANSTRAAEVPDIINGLGIDFGAFSIFAFLYYRENISKNSQSAKLSREENLSILELRVDEKKILPVSAFREIARLVILAGPASFITEPFKLSEPFIKGTMERGVLLVPFATDGNSPVFEFEESEETKEWTSIVLCGIRI
ncbi:unnamed protein product [Fraxinus pennsylvanica]|uniref:Uncharacterized protein n=1 Tax=Fraxinus pennsylvanica TaxID=56036 RepID=A0AAD2E6I0_9LAMI|nr:unnamed protein product [Fraxinus pennsylvanica]